jgi:HPt (histidine-containing phosphotransfer) domain-containing protein
VFLDLIEVYRSELSAGIAVLQSAVASRDVEAIRKVAHALKGSSLTLGAPDSGRYARAFRRVLKDGKLKRRSSALGSLSRRQQACPSSLRGRPRR